MDAVTLTNPSHNILINRSLKEPLLVNITHTNLTACQLNLKHWTMASFLNIIVILKGYITMTLLITL